jgi:aryl-alcohol dehydrogenase-like predicted oxidoreductase
MNHQALGRSGPLVSSLALGTMTFGSGSGVAGLRPVVDAHLAARMVALAVERGVTLFDSAARYNGGTAETVLGAALRPYRDRVVVSTKDPVFPDAGPAPAQIRASVEGSLRRLNLEFLHVYHAGASRLDQPIGPIIDGLAAVVEAGLVRHVGVTNVPAWQLDRAAAAAAASDVPLVSAQMSFSLLDRQLEYEFAPLFAEHGIGVLAWSPLAGGFLSGKYTSEDPAGAGGRLASFRLQPLDIERGYATVDVLREVADAHAVTPAAVALAWVGAHRFVASVLFGATTLDGLLDNLAAGDLVLAAGELAALDAASEAPKPYPYWLYPD